MKQIDELDIMQSAYLLHKKVENKHCEQVNFVFDLVLVHTRGPWDLLHSEFLEKTEHLTPIKIQNDYYNSELICQDSTFRGSTLVIWTLGLWVCLMIN